MSPILFLVLLLLGSLGIFLSFLRARSRAVLAQDGFATPGRRAAAMFLLAAVLLLTVAIPFAAGLAGGEPNADRPLSFVGLFGVHAVLALFLVCYYVLSGRRSWRDFLRLRSERPAADLSAGIFIGAAGWLLTLLLAALFVGAYVLVRGGPPGQPGGGARVSPLISWMVARPASIKIAIVVSAMFIEEFFFRAFLQTRVGPLAATLMFTAAHGAYGQPIVLVGILVISTVLSLTLHLYRNVLPCIVAHGVFDGIQMFLVIPMILKALPGPV